VQGLHTKRKGNGKFGDRPSSSARSQFGIKVEENISIQDENKIDLATL
jgi:hypothetical protein